MSLGPVARAAIVRSIVAIESLAGLTAPLRNAAIAEAASSPAGTRSSSVVAARGCDHCELKLSALAHHCRQLGPITAEITVYRSGLAVARLGPLAYFNSPNLGAWIGKVT
ncbi:MAG: hypothetical protein LLG14_03945 [Nocardiaceae bacterium]|nr:hypothetical protein [Nocardiaceae bacterium]